MKKVDKHHVNILHQTEKQSTQHNGNQTNKYSKKSTIILIKVENV